MKLLRLLSLACALVVVAVLPAAARAGNKVWVGETGAKGLQEAFSSKCFGVSPRLTKTSETVGQIGVPESHYEIVDDGTIKAFTVLGYTQAKANNPPQDPPDATVRFDLLRPFGSQHPTKIAESAAAGFLDGTTSNAWTQEVHAGDGMGVDLEANPGNEESQAWIGCTAGIETAFGPNNAIWSPPLVSGNAAGAFEESTQPGYGLELGAEVEYDAPMITGITPSSGPLKGETKVTITGSHMKLDHVELGGNDTGKYEDADGQTIISVPAAHGEGPVDVTVTTAGGTAVLEDGYTYVHVPGEETGGGGGGGGKETQEECEEREEEGEQCEAGLGKGGSGGGGGSQKTPEVPTKPNPGPISAPAPAPTGNATPAPTTFKLPQIKVAKAGALSFSPIAPGPGVFQVQGVIVLPGNPHANHTKSVVFGSATAHAASAGPQAIKLTPSAAAKHLLAHAHMVQVHLTVTFTSSAGGKTTHATVVTVRA